MPSHKNPDRRPLIGFICGSLRKASINQTLQTALIARFEDAGLESKVLDLGAYDLPIFHGDLGVVDGAGRLADHIKACDGIVIVSPEYNGGLPPLLKNALDWTSTLGPDPFKSAYWGIASCTPGPMSGIMCMRQINYILMRVGGHVSPIQVGVGNAETAFDETGGLIAEPSSSLADKLIQDMLAHL